MIRITIKPENEKAVTDSLASTDGRIRFACATGLARGLLIAAGEAQRFYLSGPRPEILDVRTGRLRGSVATEVEVNGNDVTGRIGSNVPYAAFHEFGFFGDEQVRAHTRVRGWNKGGRAKETTRYVGRRGGLGYSKDIRPAEVRLGLSNFSSIEDVRAHVRHIEYAGRPFLRPALENTDLMAEVNQELRKVANG